MHGGALLAQENKALRAANEKQKRKRGQGRVYIGQEGILTGEEGLARAQTAQAAQQMVDRGVEDSNQPTKKRAPARCSNITLYETIKSFQSHLKSVHGFLAELEALGEVLAPLTDTVNANVGLSALNFPYYTAENACRDFKEEIMKCSSRSGGGRTSF
ncbi:hypothetical protein ACO22_07152 [Paracoccidioides brasiliensis]|uniref:Azaphilone pigments biosynthesis cluster protein L N-terminal domain-containing protein n=1 Tax=Paracoccidioides brasiliensis TaxID=121759 RepID=A0A1D2J5G8_PARBR|nr:hypothetical protein ACO22_07152 [Paracoccidioides brasiliensis]